VTDFAAGEVDGVGGTLVSYDGREVPFDLLVTVPLHGCARVRRLRHRARPGPVPDGARAAAAPARVAAEPPREADVPCFLVDAQQWNEEIAEGIARENGVDELTPRHWLVVRFVRDRYLETGNAPS